MRKILIAMFTLMFVLVGGVAAQSVLARPLDAGPLTFPVTGTFSPGYGVTGVAFQGTVTVQSFGVQDGQLAVQGALAATDDSLFSPFAVTIPVRPGTHQEALARLLPFVAAMRQKGSEATAFVCRDFACHEPVTTPEALAAQLVTGR